MERKSKISDVVAERMKDNFERMNVGMYKNAYDSVVKEFGHENALKYADEKGHQAFTRVQKLQNNIRLGAGTAVREALTKADMKVIKHPHALA